MLSMNLKGKRVFIAGIGDDRGFGWSIAKSLAEAGAEILVGTWAPIYKIFTTSFTSGKFDSARKLSTGELLEFAKVYPIDGSFDTPDDVPEEIKENKRYKEFSHYTISEVAQQVGKDFGTIDIIIHSLANAPEVQKLLLETSRKGYLAAMSSSAYSFISLVSHFLPIMNEGGSALTLSYLASERAVPGYGGGMSSAKAALESDVRTMAWEAGRKKGIRINAISAGALASRAAVAIGSGVDGRSFIEKMIDYGRANAPLTRQLESDDVAHTAAFLCSSLASAITGSVVYVDNGLNIMGIACDSLR
jgi:enoyl-[acyl-carrier protein] reductase I